MPQSYQDDLFDKLETFAETTYIYLVLAALQRRLNPDEIYLLERAAQVARHIPRIAAAARL